MQFYRTVDSDGYLRIEEYAGAAITLYLHGDAASIISLYVPKPDRREGVGTMLLNVAEKEIFSRGVTKIEADYSDETEGMTFLLESAGYKVIKSAPICAVDTEKILDSEKINKILKKSFSDASFLSLDEIPAMKLREFLKIMARFSINLSAQDLGRFSNTMSGVVYDKDGAVQTVLLCSEKEDSVFVEYLVSAGKGSNSFVMAALKGMLLELIASGGAIKYPSITAFSVNDSVLKLMESVLSEKPEEIGAVMYASKDKDSETETDACFEDEIEEDLDENQIDEWRSEIERVPLQDNIVWKALWYRERNVTGKKKTSPEVSDHADDTHENPVLEESVKPSISKGSEKPDFPYELPDPLDINYGYEKDEDETEGLINSGIRRITADNFDDFRDTLPDDALQDLPRPRHRGLVMGDSADASYLVYELKNTMGKKDSRSEIRWASLTDEAELLLEEYANEAKKAGVTLTYLETEVSPQKEAVLAEAGFRTDERESQILEIAVSDLLKIPFVKGKTPDYVLGLSDISERQFKRGIANCMINNRKGLLSDLAFLPIKWFEQDVSSVVVTDGKVNGLLLVHQLPSRRLSVDLLFSSGADARIDIMRMIARSVFAATAKYPGNTPVLLHRHDGRSRAVTDRLFPDKKGDKVLYGEREE